MDVTPLIKVGQNVIQSYKGGVFKVSGQVFEGPVILSSAFVTDWDSRRSVSKLSEGDSAVDGGLLLSDFDIIIQQSQEFDVFLLGTGLDQFFLSPELQGALKERGVSFDCMATGAACRTYNVLITEERRVLAALLPAV